MACLYYAILCFLMFMSACYNELETVDFEEQEEQQSVSIEDGMCIIQSLDSIL